ncbi:MAG TPA: hypothetical protein VGF54_12255 [Streptosporangiaceae bacterium]|jgi:hypothetical protein
MYRDAVEQATRNDIAAAAAVQQELGRDYDDAVAESLVDRIGAEIDKRVDARLRTGSSGSRSPAESSRSGKGQAIFLGAGIGAGITGVVAMIASDTQSPARPFPVMSWVIAVWVVLAVAGLGTALVRMYRSRERC